MLNGHNSRRVHLILDGTDRHSLGMAMRRLEPNVVPLLHFCRHDVLEVKAWGVQHAIALLSLQSYHKRLAMGSRNSQIAFYHQLVIMGPTSHLVACAGADMDDVLVRPNLHPVP